MPTALVVCVHVCVAVCWLRWSTVRDSRELAGER